MDFGFTPEEVAFRNEVREFLRREVTKELVEEVDSRMGLGSHTWELLRKLGAKGWLTPHWPKEYGGLGGTYIQRLIIQEELAYHGGPEALTGVGMTGPVILMSGSEEQKREYLPRIARGEIEFALGYSEPEAGSDLAALELRAVKKGNYYVMNGQKVFNTACHYAHYHWLGARTDPDVPKHRGISLFIVDLKSPGITIRPMWGMNGMRTNEVFYDDVRVPAKNLVGEENKGWGYIGRALDFERTWVAGETRRVFEMLVSHVKENKALAQNPLVKQKLAELAMELEVVYLFGCRVAWMVSKGMVPSYEAAMGKVFGSEVYARIVKAGIEILGPYGALQRGSKWAPMEGEFDYRYRDCVRPQITRGASEIMRNIVALRGLGLPRG